MKYRAWEPLIKGDTRISIQQSFTAEIKPSISKTAVQGPNPLRTIDPSQGQFVLKLTDAAAAERLFLRDTAGSL